MRCDLPVRTAAFGADNPDTLVVFENLVRWTGLAGDPAGARDLFAELLKIREGSRKVDESWTVRTRERLAYWTAQAQDHGHVVQ